MVTQVGVLLYSERNINGGSRKEVYHEDLIEEEELAGGGRKRHLHMYRYTVHTCNLYFDYVLDSTFVQSLERIGNGLYVEYTVRGGRGCCFVV